MLWHAEMSNQDHLRPKLRRITALQGLLQSQQSNKPRDEKCWQLLKLLNLPSFNLDCCVTAMQTEDVQLLLKCLRLLWLEIVLFQSAGWIKEVTVTGVYYHLCKSQHIKVCNAFLLRPLNIWELCQNDGLLSHLVIVNSAWVSPLYTHSFRRSLL